MSAPLSTRTRSDDLSQIRNPEGDAELCRATLYTALALGFRAPTSETVERLGRRESVTALADAARVLERAAGAEGIASCVESLAEVGADVEALAASHRRLFGHTARGEVPAYETEYGNEALFQQPQELGDLAGFAAAFGLAPRREEHERIDHVACECEFAAFLSFKEAYALQAGDDEMLEVTRRAAALFLRDHLGRLAPAFAGRVARGDGCGFYASLGKLLLALATHHCRRLGVATGPDALGLRPDPSVVSTPMGCEAAGESGCPAGRCA